MNIYLRALEINDFVSINRWRNDELIAKYLASNHYFVSSEREKVSIEKKIFDDSNHLYLGICEIKTNVLVGYCSINNIDLRNCKAEWGGTLIGKESFGKGYGLESARLMLRYLFDEYPIHKCHTSCLEGHPKTSELFKKLGFKEDGILRDEIYKNGKYNNVVLYSILRNEINDYF